jgi:cell wall-active antibiotic response 4TMS protein YvqF
MPLPSGRRIPPATFILIALGILLLVGQLMGRSPVSVARVWWPVVLIAIGIARLASRPAGGLWTGALLLLLGLGLLLRNLDVLTLEQLMIALPLVLIVAGVALLLGRRR